jgi:hypothetical protein
MIISVNGIKPTIGLSQVSLLLIEILNSGKIIYEEEDVCPGL